MAATGCDAAFLCELSPRTYASLDRLPGTLLGVPNPREASVGERECGIYVRPGLNIEGTALHQLTRDLGTPIAPARHARTGKVEGLGLLSFHANAATQNRATGRWRRAKRAREWQRGLERLGGLVDGYQSAGTPVIAGGDANVRAKGPASFAHFARAHDLTPAHNGRVMWISWSKEYERTNCEVLGIPPGGVDRNGHGHRGLLITLEKNKDSA